MSAPARRSCARQRSRQATWSATSTTTATVIARAIIREGTKAIAAGMNPMDLKRGIDQAVVADLKARSRTVSGHDEIAQVGTISANGDNAIGSMVADAMAKVGNEGAISIEEAKSLETELEVVEGLQFDRELASRPVLSPTGLAPL